MQPLEALISEDEVF